MVVGAFPIAKLSVLLVKQISKPIANICKERAKASPFFRTYVCMPPAQFYNWCEVKAKMWVLNLGKPVNIPVLSQEMAIELGANLLGEGLIFMIGAGLLIIEYNRQSNKEYAKELKRQDEMDHITSTINELYFTVQQQQTQLREMERLIHSKIGVKVASPEPTQPPPQPRLPPSGGVSPQNINQMRTQEAPPSTPTPYPNTGVILRSLNYIQMDVFSSSAFTGTADEVRPPSDPIDPVKQRSSAKQRRGAALLTGTLREIENNFRSLF